MNYALHSRICCLKIRKTCYSLVVADENHGIERILKVLCHELLLDRGTAALIDEVKWKFNRSFVVELVRLASVDEVLGRNH